MNVLVIAPHPDDDLIGCGGSVIKHLEVGHSITIVYLTSGEAGGTLPAEKLGKLREMEALKSTKSIGIAPGSLHFLRQPDGHLTVTKPLVNQIAALIRTVTPEIVYLPHAHDAHPDHRAAHKLGTEAIELASLGQRWHPGTVLAYEVWTPIRKPGYIEEITDVFNKKLAALEFHKSQFEILAYDDLATSLGTYRAILLGKKRRAEAFEVLSLTQSSLI